MSALGSLVVKLGLEYAEFTGGLDKSEQAALASAKRVQDTFDGMKSKLAATAGAIAGGLAAGFTVAAFKSLIGGAVATGAAFDDLAMQTGSTVEALSALSEIGKFNDMAPEKIGAAMNVLTRNLAGATEESKGTGAAIKALGIDMGAFRALKPEDQMQAVATALDGVQDGAGKSAVMMALYGKEGAQMLPFMKDLASVGELQAKVTAEQAAAAAQLDDNWVKLTTTGSETAKEVAMGMVPAFDEAVRAAMDVMAGTGGMREMLRGLVADGSIKQWTTDAIKGLSYVADAGHIAWRVLQSIGKGLGGLAAALVQALQGDFRGAWNVLKDSGQDMIDTFDGPTIGARFRESLDKVAVSSEAAGDSAKKTALDFRNLGEGAKGAKGEADKLAQSGTDLAQSLLAQDSGLSGDFHKKWDSLSAAYRANKIGLDVLIAAQAQLLEQQPAMKKAFDDTVKASQAAADARRKEADGIRQWFDQQEQAVAQSLAAVQDRITSLRDEGEALALAREKNISLAEAVERLAIARLEEKQARFIDGSEGWQAIQKEIEKRKELLGLVSSKAQREDEARGWADMWQSVDRTAHDTFVNVLEGGQDAFKRLGNTLKASVLDVLYQMTVRKWMINIGTSVFGAGFGAAANAATGGGAGGALSTAGGIGNMASLASGIGSFTTAGMLPTGIATALTGSTSSLAMGLSGAWGAGGGMLSTLNAGASMLGSGSVMSGLGTIAGALGPIAIGIALLSSLIKKSTPHAGGIGAYSAASGATTGSSVGLAFGIDQKHYTQAGEDLSTTVAKSIVGILDATATTFGKQAGYYAATAFADDSSKDGAWGALRIKFGEKVLLDWADTAVRDANVPREFADGEAGSKEYLAEVAKSARDALVQAIGSVDWATDMLKGLGDTVSLESLAQTVQQINAAKAAFVGFGQYMPAFASLADSAVSKIVQASGGVDALAGNMSVFVAEFFTEEERLKVATDSVTAELAKLGYEMPRTRDEFKALLQAQLALGDAGADTAAKLLQLTGAVASVTQQSATATAQMQAEASDRRAFVKARREMQEAEQKVQLDAMEASKTAAAELFKSIQDHIKGIDDWLKGALLDTNSLLSPEGKVQEAQAQFDALYARAAGGDADAMGQLTNAASALRDVARDAYASSGAYGSIEMDLRARLAALEAGAFDPNRPAVQATEWWAGSGNGNGGPTVAEVMAATGLSFQAAAGLTSYRNASGQYAAGTADLSGGITVDALRDAARALALGDGGAASWSTWAGDDGIERLRLALADGTFAQTDAGNASGVYDMAFRLGLTDAEARAGLALTGDGQKADGQWWVNNWNEQSAAIGNWVKTSGQGQDTMTHLYQIQADASRASQEQVEAVRASGSANAQGLVEQTQVLQSIDRRLANMESSNRMGAIA